MGFFVIFTGIREGSKTARAPIFREKTKKWRKNLVVSRITPTFAAVIERASGMPQIIQAIGVWCNGNTTDSGPVFPGSSPGTPTKAAASFTACCDALPPRGCCRRGTTEKAVATIEVGDGLFVFAERGGFEPPIPFRGIHAFQACLYNHSSISPLGLKRAVRLRNRVQRYDYFLNRSVFA